MDPTEQDGRSRAHPPPFSQPGILTATGPSQPPPATTHRYWPTPNSHCTLVTLPRSERPDRKVPFGDTTPPCYSHLPFHGLRFYRATIHTAGVNGDWSSQVSGTYGGDGVRVRRQGLEALPRLHIPDPHALIKLQAKERPGHSTGRTGADRPSEPKLPPGPQQVTCVPQPHPGEASTLTEPETMRLDCGLKLQQKT